MEAEPTGLSRSKEPSWPKVGLSKADAGPLDSSFSIIAYIRQPLCAADHERIRWPQPPQEPPLAKKSCRPFKELREEESIKPITHLSLHCMSLRGRRCWWRLTASQLLSSWLPHHAGSLSAVSDLIMQTSNESQSQRKYVLNLKVDISRDLAGSIRLEQVLM